MTPHKPPPHGNRYSFHSINPEEMKVTNSDLQTDHLCIFVWGMTARKKFSFVGSTKGSLRLLFTVLIGAIHRMGYTEVSWSEKCFYMCERNCGLRIIRAKADVEESQIKKKNQGLTLSHGRVRSTARRRKIVKRNGGGACDLSKQKG